MSDTAIAKRYASALFEVVQGDEAAETRVRGEVSALAEVLAQPELARLVDNPRVSGADKAAILAEVARRTGAGEEASRLLKVLVANGRAGALGEIAGAYGRLVDAARGRQTVTVTASHPLPDAARDRVEQRLRALLGGATEIRHRVDPEALGGLVVQVGGKVFDYSVRNHLMQLRQAI